MKSRRRGYHPVHPTPIRFRRRARLSTLNFTSDLDGSSTPAVRTAPPRKGGFRTSPDSDFRLPHPSVETEIDGREVAGDAEHRDDQRKRVQGSVTSVIRTVVAHVSPVRTLTVTLTLPTLLRLELVIGVREWRPRHERRSEINRRAAVGSLYHISYERSPVTHNVRTKSVIATRTSPGRSTTKHVHLESRHDRTRYRAEKAGRILAGLYTVPMLYPP